MKIFFDMDGTLSEFKLVGPSEWAAPGYARGLNPILSVVTALKRFIAIPTYFGEKVEVFICSAVVSMDFAVEDKIYWLKEQGINLPKENLIFVPYGKSKAEALAERGITIESGDLFLDDYTKNLIDLRKIDNLTPVKLLNGINDTNKTWGFDRVSAFSCPATIQKQLMGISRMAKMFAA